MTHELYLSNEFLNRWIQKANVMLWGEKGIWEDQEKVYKMRHVIYNMLINYRLKLYIVMNSCFFPFGVCFLTPNMFTFIFYVVRLFLKIFYDSVDTDLSIHY